MFLLFVFFLFFFVLLGVLIMNPSKKNPSFLALVTVFTCCSKVAEIGLRAQMLLWVSLTLALLLQLLQHLKIKEAVCLSTKLSVCSSCHRTLFTHMFDGIPCRVMHSICSKLSMFSFSYGLDLRF